MSNYRRRRFLTDLLFVGGALLAAAGLASTGQANPGDTPTPLKTPEVTPSAAPTCEMPMPGSMPAPPPSLTRTLPTPARSAPHNAAGGVAPAPRNGK